MTELDIDQSHLPRVQEVCQCFAVLEDGALAHNLQEQEIEQYYNSNVQKNQLVQNDIRIARRLQDEEDQQARLSQASRQLEEQDSEYARMIQEEIERRAEEEARRREEEDEEMAKRLQEEEEMEIRRQRPDSGCHGDTSDTLTEGAALRRDGGCLELGELEQVLRDEELARRLQEEEERLLRKSPRSSSGPRNLDSREDFRAAQVAQDEEIARFMQRRERRAQRQSCDMEGQGSRWDHRDPGDAHERRSARERRVELPRTPRERLDSEGLNSPGEDLSPDCQTPSPNCTSPNSQAVRNIAEELDPTFKPSRRESNPSQTSGLSTSPSSHSGLHDYTQEPTFVPPTKRQSDKSVRPKSKEKKESCKQQ